MIRTAGDRDLRVVAIDHPTRRNALRPTDLDALGAAVTGVGAPVILLRGSGPAFCAGVNLDSVTGLDDPEAFAKHGQRVADTVESAESVIVAGIDGAARGGGAELVLACDIRVTTPRTALGGPGVQLDLLGAQGGAVQLPRVVGEGHALESSLSGRIINAGEVLQMGLVSRIVDDPGEVATPMADNNHQLLQIVKERLRDRGNRDGRLKREVAGFAKLHWVSVDGTAASREK